MDWVDEASRERAAEKCSDSKDCSNDPPSPAVAKSLHDALPLTSSGQQPPFIGDGHNAKRGDGEPHEYLWFDQGIIPFRSALKNSSGSL